MTKNLRVGLVGLGMMGRHHARVLAQLDGIEFIAIAEPADARHRHSQGRPIVKTVTELISFGIDYAVVASPTINHLENCLELAASRIHVLVEKPISHDSASAMQIVNAFNRAGLVGAVGHVERFNPALQEARQRLEALGSIFQVVTRRQGPFPSRITDVGVVKDLATHDIDLTSWITGQKYISISAQTAFKAGRDTEDLVMITGVLQNQILTNHLVNWLSPLKERVVIITGENGAFLVDTLTADLTYYANGTKKLQWEELSQFRGISEGDVIRYAITKSEPLRTEHENFRDSVLGKSSEIVSMAHGFSVIEVAESVLKSATNNSVVKIEHVKSLL